jgi:hypothetical protein
MKKLSGILVTGITVLIISLLFTGASCKTAKGEGFAIYLTRDDVPPAKMEALSHVDLAENPLISLADIISYNAQTYELKLTNEAYERIADLEVPVRGKSFMVCVDKSPVYWGAFWTPVSSQSFNGVTIWKPFGNSHQGTIITLQLGYPSSSFYGGEDPRNSPEVIESLEQSGKLINRLSLNMIDKLPGSMKGYELYSWAQEGRWYFTLITGTNRNKTLAEIISPENILSESGWVKITTAGVEETGIVLRKLPEKTPVFWLNGLRQTEGPAYIKLELPPQEIIEAIRKYAGQYGLDIGGL